MTNVRCLEASLLVLFNTSNNDQEDSKQHGNEVSRLDRLEITTQAEINGKMQFGKSQAKTCGTK